MNNVIEIEKLVCLCQADFYKSGLDDRKHMSFLFLVFHFSDLR
jgi:hypothetical protein